MTDRRFFYLFVFSACLLLVSCGGKDSFKIKGNVSDAAGSTLYLEQITLSSVAVIDSVKLNEKGKFSFKQARPEAPEFYRLKLGGSAINISIDSTEQVTVTASSKDFATAYTVEGSDNCMKIKELTLVQLRTNEAYNKLLKERQNLPEEEYQQGLIDIANKHKEEVKKYIFDAPSSAVAYFALFQQINNLLIFNPYDKDDNKMYATVATSWDMYYPNAQRTKHLRKLTLQAMKELRAQRPQNLNNIEIKNTLSFFEIVLPDLYGNSLKLSDIAGKGNVVLVDFTAYQSRVSLEHNMQLASVYEKYQSKGLDIFQISLDSDRHFWQNAASNIPWKAVHDPEGAYSRIASIYNVRNIPVSFILNRQGEIVKRVEVGDKLEAELLKVL